MGENETELITNLDHEDIYIFTDAGKPIFSLKTEIYECTSKLVDKNRNHWIIASNYWKNQSIKRQNRVL